MEILADLRERPSGPTRISRAVNLSYDRCSEMLKELESRGLIIRSEADGHDSYGVTPAGSRLVDDWSSVWKRLNP